MCASRPITKLKSGPGYQLYLIYTHCLVLNDLRKDGCDSQNLNEMNFPQSLLRTTHERMWSCGFHVLVDWSTNRFSTIHYLRIFFHHWILICWGSCSFKKKRKRNFGPLTDLFLFKCWIVVKNCSFWKKSCFVILWGWHQNLTLAITIFFLLLNFINVGENIWSHVVYFCDISFFCPLNRYLTKILKVSGVHTCYNHNSNHDQFVII